MEAAESLGSRRSGAAASLAPLRARRLPRTATRRRPQPVPAITPSGYRLTRARLGRDACTECAGRRTKGHWHTGYGAREVVDDAIAHDADVIVMGSRGRSDLVP